MYKNNWQKDFRKCFLNFTIDTLLGTDSFNNSSLIDDTYQNSILLTKADGQELKLRMLIEHNGDCLP